MTGFVCIPSLSHKLIFPMSYFIFNCLLYLIPPHASVPPSLSIYLYIYIFLQPLSLASSNPFLSHPLLLKLSTKTRQTLHERRRKQAAPAETG
jgi:hypothetical protein